MVRRKGARQRAEPQLTVECRARRTLLIAPRTPHHTSSKMREIVHVQTGQCGNQIGTKVSVPSDSYLYMTSRRAGVRPRTWPFAATSRTCIAGARQAYLQVHIPRAALTPDPVRLVGGGGWGDRDRDVDEHDYLRDSALGGAAPKSRHATFARP